MRIHYLQHVPFEDLAGIEPCLQDHQLSVTRLYCGEMPPEPTEFDWLIIMGGPMGIGDEALYPWLATEKKHIYTAIYAGKTVLGVCLGAQLVADALGAAVTRNPHKEIGWFPLKPDKAAADTVLSGVLTEDLEVFHWHGDTFEIPAGAVPLASSAGCRNQGFVFDNRVVALQFHLETTPESAQRLIDNCADELNEQGLYIQSAAEILADPSRFVRIHHTMRVLLDILSQDK